MSNSPDSKNSPTIPAKEGTTTVEHPIEASTKSIAAADDGTSNFKTDVQDKNEHQGFSNSGKNFFF